MKPLLIFVPDTGDKVTMTKEQIEKLVMDAYEQGKADGATLLPYHPTPYYPYSGTGNWSGTAPKQFEVTWCQNDSVTKTIQPNDVTFIGSMDKLDMA